MLTNVAFDIYDRCYDSSDYTYNDRRAVLYYV